MKFILYLLLLNLASCTISQSPPIVIHEQHGEMLADNAIFQKDAIECAGISHANVGPINNTVDAALEMFIFFNSSDSCISNRGWAVKEK
ncbi:hypothetical protein [Colwellia sp. TT2012]|uniref:hypothetical protein n=1 Tax=Colwellia sp. TT2012 TaxID=1720342 RepID=UPI000A9EFB44|nr:hypothetical protein [Colwellia sp. TT2012]